MSSGSRSPPPKRSRNPSGDIRQALHLCASGAWPADLSWSPHEDASSPVRGLPAAWVRTPALSQMHVDRV